MRRCFTREENTCEDVDKAVSDLETSLDLGLDTSLRDDIPILIKLLR